MDGAHNYTDTINAARLTADGGDKERLREKRQDAEAAYEALAVTSAMGMLGMEETEANLLQLELARELDYLRRLDK